MVVNANSPPLSPAGNVAMMVGAGVGSNVSVAVDVKVGKAVGAMTITSVPDGEGSGDGVKVLVGGWV